MGCCYLYSLLWFGAASSRWPVVAPICILGQCQMCLVFLLF